MKSLAKTLAVLALALAAAFGLHQVVPAAASAVSSVVQAPASATTTDCGPSITHHMANGQSITTDGCTTTQGFYSGN